MPKCFLTDFSLMLPLKNNWWDEIKRKTNVSSHTKTCLAENTTNRQRFKGINVLTLEFVRLSHFV